MAFENYWSERTGLAYYEIVKSWLEDITGGHAIVDVGHAGTPVASWGSFRRRYAVDRLETPAVDGVEMVVADWLEWEPPQPVTVVTCLQVLEHLDFKTAERFAQKMIQTAPTVIVSIPYRWEAGKCVHHKLDPMSLRTVLELFALEPWKVERTERRLVVMFRAPHSPFMRF